MPSVLYTRQMSDLISVIIPARNTGATIGVCLDAVFAFTHDNFEVIVVDDASEDDTADIARQFSCTLLSLDVQSGAAKARNVGAEQATGKIFFFTDADCVPLPDALEVALNTLRECKEQTVLGGTYTAMSFDNRFFSNFQSVFINYSETKSAENPDYIATHAMAISAELFRKHFGFRENHLPILEDVEFSHRLRSAGVELQLDPNIKVRHIFNFNLLGSMRNAFRKSMYWIIYSIGNRDILSDSGTASIGLKVNAGLFMVSLMLLAMFAILGNTMFVYSVGVLELINVYINRGQLTAFYRAGGIMFGLISTLYYLFIYPIPVASGTVMGMLKYIMRIFRGNNQ